MSTPTAVSTLTSTDRRKRQRVHSPAPSTQSVKPRGKQCQLPVFTLRDIVKRMLSSPSAVYFSSLPSEKDFPGYREEVSHVDLTMVLEGVNRGAYRGNTKRFEEDMRRVWTNALTYFPKAHVRHQLAEANSKHFETLLEEAYRQKDPLKAMQDRVELLERQLKEVNARMTRRENRRNKPISEHEVSRLSVEIQSLPDQFRRGLLAVAPRVFITSSESTCEVNLGELSREEHSDIRRYLRECRKALRPPKKQRCGKPVEVAPPQNQQTDTAPPQNPHDQVLRKGQAEMVQARGEAEESEESSSSSSSEDTDETMDNGSGTSSRDNL